MNFDDLLREKAALGAALAKLEQDSGELDARSDKTFANMQTIANESLRVADVAHNVQQILDDLDREFEQKTNIVVPMSRTKKGRKRDLVKNIKDRIITRTSRVG